MIVALKRYEVILYAINKLCPENGEKHTKMYNKKIQCTKDGLT